MLDMKEILQAVEQCNFVSGDENTRLQARATVLAALIRSRSTDRLWERIDRFLDMVEEKMKEELKH